MIRSLTKRDSCTVVVDSCVRCNNNNAIIIINNNNYNINLNHRIKRSSDYIRNIKDIQVLWTTDIHKYTWFWSFEKSDCDLAICFIQLFFSFLAIFQSFKIIIESFPPMLNKWNVLQILIMRCRRKLDQCFTSFAMAICRQFLDIHDGVSSECTGSSNNNGGSCGLLSNPPEKEGIPETWHHAPTKKIHSSTQGNEDN